MQTRLPWAAEPSPCEQAEVIQWPDSLRRDRRVTGDRRGDRPGGEEEEGLDLTRDMAWGSQVPERIWRMEERGGQGTKPEIQTPGVKRQTKRIPPPGGSTAAAGADWLHARARARARTHPSPSAAHGGKDANTRHTHTETQANTKAPHRNGSPHLPTTHVDPAPQIRMGGRTEDRRFF